LGERVSTPKLFWEYLFVRLLNKPRVFEWDDGELVQVCEAEKLKVLARLASLLEDETYCASCFTRLTEENIGLALFSEDDVLGWCCECAEREILELLVKAFSMPFTLEQF